MNAEPGPVAFTVRLPSTRAVDRENGSRRRCCSQTPRPMMTRASNRKTGSGQSTTGRATAVRNPFRADGTRPWRPRSAERGVLGAREGPRGLPCLQVAELLGDHLADVDAQPVDDPLRQVRVRRAAEHLDVGHSAVRDVRPRRYQIRVHWAPDAANRFGW